MKLLTQHGGGKELTRRTAGSSLLILVQLLCALSSSCFLRFEGAEERGAGGRERGGHPMEVELAAAELRMYRPRHEAPGHVVAGERVVVSAPFSAEVRKVPLRPGETVHENGVVVRLETSELEEELSRLERRCRTKSREAAQQRYLLLDAVEEAGRVWHSARRTCLRWREAARALGEAQEELASQRELYEAGGISRSSLRQCRKRVEAREFELRRLEVLLEEKCIGLRTTGAPAEPLAPEALAAESLAAGPAPTDSEATSGEDRQEQDYRFLENADMRRAYLRKAVERQRGVIRIAEAEKAEAEAAREILRGRIARAAVRSPVSGVVLSIRAQRGEFVERGARLCSLYDPRELRAELHLGESAASGIARGNPGSFRIPPDGTDIPAEVVSVSPEVDPRSKSFRVRLRIPSPSGSPEAERRLKPGMYVETRVYSSESIPVLAIPESALRRRIIGVSPSGKSAEIYRFIPLDDGKGRVRREQVRLYRTTEGTALITSGMDPDSLVCADPPAGLQSGAVVRGLLP